MTTTALPPAKLPAQGRATTPTGRSAPLRDVATMTRRELRRALRSIDSLVTAFALPPLIMLVFVVIFGGAVDPTGNYITYVVPGIIIMCLGFGSATAAVGVAQDMTSGTIDRFKTLPILSSATLWGHVIASTLRNLASCSVVLATAYALGYRAGGGLVDWLGFVGLAVLAVLAFTWMSVTLGLVLSPEAAGMVNMVFLFVPYLSSGFVPVETMPGWLHGFAEHQPFTPIIESVRGLLGGTPDGATILTAAGWLTGLLLLSVVVGARLFRRRTAR